MQDEPREVISVARWARFTPKRAELLWILEDLFNELQREPEEVKVRVFGSKKLFYEWKEKAHELQKLEDKQVQEGLRAFEKNLTPHNLDIKTE